MTSRVHWRRRQWQATPVLLPRKSHGWRRLVGCSPWGRYKSDLTERLHFRFSLSHNGEGNGNPLQCYCLENPRDGRAWWAAVYGVAQSRTRLKRLSSSSSSSSRVHWRASQVALVVMNPPADAGNVMRLGFDPWVENIPWRRAWQPTPAFLPGESHGQRSLAGYSPCGHRVRRD